MHALMCPHGRDLDDLARELATDLDGGLSEPAAEQRLRRLGPNRLPAPERPAYFAIAARQLADPLVALLVAATAVSFLIGEYLAAGVIAGIVLLNGARRTAMSRPSTTVSPTAMTAFANCGCLDGESKPWHDCDRSRLLRFSHGLTTETALQKCCSVGSPCCRALRSSADSSLARRLRIRRKPHCLCVLLRTR